MSKLPEVLEHLHALAVARMASQEQVAVKLGPLRQDLDEDDAIGIGVDATTEEGEPARATTLLRLASFNEQFDITCVCQSLNGDDDLVAACRRADELHDELVALMPELTEMAGVWEASVVSRTYRPVRTDGGALAVIESVVRVETNERE